MGTLVCFHAHPDDEAIATGGLMARAAKDGHRVVLVTATRGECGEVREGLLVDGETLGERRTRELETACAVLGVARLEFLGYRDSGMDGTPENADPACFWQADVEEAAGRLAAILREEQAEVVTVYDENGAYGHPDHIQVHRVGIRAAELAGTPRVYEAVMNRDHIRRGMEEMRAASLEAGAEPPGGEDFDPEGFGVPESLITAAVDVSDFLVTKRAALAAHASQIDESSFFLSMPDEVFSRAFGTEWFVERGAVPRPPEEFDTELL